jgi:uncharacterized membrane protein
VCHFCISLGSAITIEKQYLLNYFKPHELVFVRNGLFIIPLLCLLFMDKSIKGKVLNMDKKICMCLITTSVLSIISLSLFWYVLSKNKTHYAVSIVHPLFISFSVILSYLFFKEKLNAIQLLGFILVLIGIMIINSNKD